jgi:hypothetical protein
VRQTEDRQTEEDAAEVWQVHHSKSGGR